MASIIRVCILMCVQQVARCEIPTAVETRHARNGDYIIGGIFPMHRRGETRFTCSPDVTLLGLEYSETMMFAVDEINANPAILAGKRLGFDIRDNCRSEALTLYAATSLATGQRSPSGQLESEPVPIPIGMIGPESSVNAVVAGNVASLYEIPIISHYATSDELSNKERFPYFLRTVPPDKFQARAIIDILIHYDWTYVGLLYSADSYGIPGSLEVTKLAEEHGICVAFSIAIREEATPSEINSIVAKVRSFPKATVIAIFSYSTHTKTVLRGIHVDDPMRQLICLASDGLSSYDFENLGLGNATIGSFFIKQKKSAIPSVDEHFQRLQSKSGHDLSPWLIEYIQQRFAREQCTNLTSCPVTINFNAPQTYWAVYALAHALDNILSSDSNENRSDISGKTVLPYLLNVSFQSIGDFVEFDSDGNSGDRYQLKSYQFSPRGIYESVYVGIWDFHRYGGRLVISEDVVKWPGGNRHVPISICREECKPGFIPVPLESNCCWGCQSCTPSAIVVNGNTCQPCSPTFWPNTNRTDCEAIVPTSLNIKSAASITIMAASTLGVIACLLTAIGLYHYRDHALIKATSRELSCINLSGLAVTFCTVYLLLARPSPAGCMASEALISLSFTIIYSPTLLKVNRIYRIFKESRKSVRRPRFIGPKHQALLASLFILLQVFLSVISAIFWPSTPAILIPSEARKYLALYCSFNGGFVATVVYNTIIILACCLYAFKTRKVPSNYNESKFIAVSVYSTVMLFLAVIPVYATAIRVIDKIAALCSALIFNAYLTLVLHYVPKLYGILFGHELNVRKWRSMTGENRVGATSGDPTAIQSSSVSKQTREMNKSTSSSSDAN